MKTRVLILLAVLGFGSLAASRVMDDEMLLANPDPYLPYAAQVSGSEDPMSSCFDRNLKAQLKPCGKRSYPVPDLKELEQRYQDLHAARERALHMSPEQRRALNQKSEHELLDKPHILPWGGDSPGIKWREICGEKGVASIKKREDSTFVVRCGLGPVQPRRFPRDGR